MAAGNAPERMQAAAFDEFGGPEVITPRILPVPQIADDEILLKVWSAGVGCGTPPSGKARWCPRAPRSRWFPAPRRRGRSPPLGRQVTNVAVGDLVYVYGYTRPKGGFYAEYAATKAQYVAKLPAGVSAEHAGAMPTDALTALSGLDVLGLPAGSWVLIFGASGGQGHLAVQLAKRQGLKVIAVASGAEGVALVTRLGADLSLEGHGDVTAALAQIRDVAPEGVDGVLAMAGGETLDRLAEALRDGGVLAYPHGVQPAPRERPAVTVRAYDGETGPERLQRLNELIEAGPFEVHVAEKFPLGRAAEAHRRLQTSYPGKLLLTVS